MQASGRAVMQWIVLDIGQTAPPHAVRSQADVLAAGLREDPLTWPSGEGTFNGDYAGSVHLAMTWGLQGGEGTAGWYRREYPAAAFDSIATATGNASDNLGGVHASLDNEKNKTLVAIRAFRGPENGSMAAATAADLAQVHVAVAGQAAALHAANLINDAAAGVTLIEADPAEAHPNTLPTAKVTFGAAGTVYFKGRGRGVEDALVGNGASAARVLSSIAGILPDGPEGVGMHGFVDPGGANTLQIAGDVGVEVAPALAPVTRLETARTFLKTYLGGADVAPRPQAINAWLSAAKSALLVSLTATTDLHASNIKTGLDKSHVIDGEFLLDLTQWQAYETMLGGGVMANFNVGAFLPGWLRAHMATLSAGTKTLMANAVVTGFSALQADKTHAWAEITAPIRALTATPALLRVAPLNTDVLLSCLTSFHNANAADRGRLVTDIWQHIVDQMNGKVAMNNAAGGRAALTANLQNGMVPLFHVRSNDGFFLLNKQTPVGHAVHSVNDLLVAAGAAVSARYADMAAQVKAAITA